MGKLVPISAEDLTTPAQKPNSNAKQIQENAKLEADVQSQSYRKLKALDDVISERESAWTGLGNAIKNAGEIMNPNADSSYGSTMLGINTSAVETAPMIQAAKIALPIADLYSQLSESPAANAILEAIENPKESLMSVAKGGMAGSSTANAIMKGITGEKRGEYGDVLRAFGAPEPIAALGGLVASAYADPFGLKRTAAQFATKKIADIPKNIARSKAAKNISRKEIFTVGGKYATEKTNPIIKLFTGKDETAKIIGGQKQLKRVRPARDLQQINDDFVSKIEKKFKEDLGEVTKSVGPLKESRKQLIQEQAELIASKQLLAEDAMSQLAPEKSIDEVRGTLRKFFKDNDEIYEKRFVGMADLVAQSDTAPSMQSMGETYEKALVEIEKQGLLSHPTAQQIIKTKEKYLGKMKQVKGEETLIPPSREIDFREMVNDYRAIRKSYKGADPVADTFKKIWDADLEEKVPAFKTLQTEYAPILSAKEYMDDVASLTGNEYHSANRIKGLLDRAASGSLKEGEERVLIKLAKNNPGFSDGINLLIDNSMKVKQFKLNSEKEILGIKKMYESKIKEMDNLIQLGEKKAATNKMALIAEKERMLRIAKDQARKGAILIKNKQKFISNKNAIRNLGLGILGYELISRPIRSAFYKITKGD